ncbi:MAG: T9SS type A sorting domain-containing protein [Saprospiraceae bacterium]
MILSAADGTVIDSVSFDEQATNVTYARLPNGTGPFSSTTPTIGATNDGSSSTSEARIAGELNIYPNPTSAQLTVNFDQLEGDSQLQVVSATGQLLHHQRLGKQGQELLDVSGFSAGVYHLSVKHEAGVLTRRFVVLAR